MVEQAAAELTKHLGSTGLMLVAVAILWWRANAADVDRALLWKKSEANRHQIGLHETKIAVLQRTRK